MNKESKKEISVTIISGMVIVATTIIMGLLSMQKEVNQVYINSPDLDNVNFVEYFGLKKGQIYHYSVFASEANMEDVVNPIKQKYNVDVTITDELHFQDAVLYLLDNNLKFPGKKKEKNGILITGNLVFFINNENIENLIDIFKGKAKQKGNTDLANLHSEPEYILPFFDGQKFGGTSTINYLRKDNRYIKYIQKEGNISFFDGQKMIDRPKYHIYSLTLGSSQYIEFIPYVGIVNHNYHHNGTTDEQLFKLNNVQNP